MRGVCRLCDRETVLEESHVIPSFVYKWLKDSSWTGFLRCGLRPNRRVQDGYKLFWLCGACEDHLNAWETTFATLVFHPFNKGEATTVSYDAWLLKFCASISWRVLNFFIEEADLNHFPEQLRNAARRAHTVWKEFLLDKRPHPERHEQHLLPLDTIKSYTNPEIPTNINRYILRSVDIDAAWGGENAFIYSKVGRFVIIGFVNVHRPKEWGGTKVHVRHGVVGPREYTLPENFLGYFFTQARKATDVLAHISKEQNQKIEQSFRKNMDRGAASESLKAMDHDVWLFGKAAFKENNE
jgi:hypothetical protein